MIRSVPMSPYIIVHCCGLSAVSGLQTTTDQAPATWTHSCLDIPVMRRSTQLASLYHSAFLILKARKSSQIRGLLDLPQPEQMPLDPTLLISPRGAPPVAPTNLWLLWWWSLFWLWFDFLCQNGLSMFLILSVFLPVMGDHWRVLTFESGFLQSSSLPYCISLGSGLGIQCPLQICLSHWSRAGDAVWGGYGTFERWNDRWKGD